MSKINKLLTFFLIAVIVLGASVWIPKFRPFGTSTTFTDSTNYVTLNKGLYTFDSIKTDKDLIVKGGLYLDTNRFGKIYYNGNELNIVNGKTSLANINMYVGNGVSYYSWQKSRSLGVDVELMKLDTATGLIVREGNIQVAGTTQQIKLPSDTATDYNSDDAITLNRQRGILTTKSLTTAVNAEYNLTLTNSLITTTSTVLAFIQTGSLSQGTPIIRAANPSSGSVAIVFRNIDPTNAINGNIKITFVVFN